MSNDFFVKQITELVVKKGCSVHVYHDFEPNKLAVTISFPGTYSSAIGKATSIPEALDAAIAEYNMFVEKGFVEPLKDITR